MERPWKRIRIADPDIRSPRDPGSQMAEGLFTSELGTRSDETDKPTPAPSRTMNLQDLQRRGTAEHQVARPPLQRRNAERDLVPRADATVTANVIEINVGDGTSTSAATTIVAASAETVVALESLGSLTVAPDDTVTSVTDPSLTDSQSPITTPPPTPLPDDTTSSTASVSDSISFTESTFSGNGTITGSASIDPTDSIDSTVTVTATSTLDIAYLNGTFITTSFSGRPTHASTSLSLGESTDSPSGIGVDPSSSDSSSTTFYGAGGPLVTGSSTTSSASAASSSTTRADDGGPGLSPEQQTVVGGVVGGIAGVALVLLGLLIFLRWYRRRLKARGELPEQIAQRNLGGISHHPSVSQRSSGVPLTAAIAASLRKFRPISSHTQGTTATASTIPESEKGFQRLAGRKIPSVLNTGGDGFGGNYGAFEKEIGGPGSSVNTHSRNGRSLAGSSFYRDSSGFYGGKGDMPSSPTTGPTATGSRSGPAPSTARDFAGDFDDSLQAHPSQISLPSSRPDGLAALRPSPARTPVTISPAASSIGLPIQHNAMSELDADAPPVPLLGMGLTLPLPPDAIGRSLVSQDGSRVSRMSGVSRGSGRSGSRFAENV